MSADSGAARLPTYAAVARGICVGAASVFAFVALLGLVVNLFSDTTARPPGIHVLGPLALAAIPVGFVAYGVWWWGRRAVARRASTASHL